MNKISEIQLHYKNQSLDLVKINNSKSAFNLLIEHWDLNTIELQEEFKCLFLDRDNKVLGIYNLSKGGTAGTVVDVKLLMVAALKTKTHAMILAHNHPSGNLRPSKNDIHLTKKLIEASLFLDVKLIDHLIISKSGYYSFVDENCLDNL